MTLFEAYNYHIYLCQNITDEITDKDTQITICSALHGNQYKTTLTINGKQTHFTDKVEVND